jgi:hypothetical protein
MKKVTIIGVTMQKVTGRVITNTVTKAKWYKEDTTWYFQECFFIV